MTTFENRTIKYYISNEKANFTFINCKIDSQIRGRSIKLINCTISDGMYIIANNIYLDNINSNTINLRSKNFTIIKNSNINHLNIIAFLVQIKNSSVKDISGKYNLFNNTTLPFPSPIPSKYKIITN